MSDSSSSSYNSQIISFVVTIFASVLTVQYLYTITNKKEILCLIFLLVLVIIASIREYIIIDIYPDRADGKIETRRAYLVRFCDLITSITIIILVTIIFDMFNSIMLKIHLQWWDYIAFFSILLTFVFSYLESKL